MKAIIRNNNIILFKDKHSYYPARDYKIENVKLSYTKKGLRVKGDLIQDELNIFNDNEYKVEEVEEKYIRISRKWFGLSKKEVKKVKTGWIVLKKRAKYNKLFSNYTVEEDE